MHVTDLTNASRTMLLDLDTLDWSPELLDLFGVDPVLLPRLVRSSEVVGEAELLGVTLPIAGIAGDQQASLFGHGCFDRGQAKATYGTGSFVLANAGAERGPAPAGLLETVAASGGYAFEGAILASGAAIQWLRDGLGILADAAESERLARSVESTGGVSFVPAFAGLGSPHWNAEARGLISGITRGTTRAHLVRAALEGIAFQVADVLDLLPGGVEVLRADGGATANGFLMQFQADLLGCPVEVAAEQETTALGAAALAGRAVGLLARTTTRSGARSGRARSTSRRPTGTGPPPAAPSGARHSSARCSDSAARRCRGARRRRRASGCTRRTPPPGTARDLRASPARSRASTGIEAVRSSARSRPSASMPSMSGSWMSIRTRSGRVLDRQLDRLRAGRRLERR